MASTGSNSSGPDVPASDASGVEVVVGLASYNHARTIREGAQAIHNGLTERYGPHRARLLLVDTGSTDGTMDAISDLVSAGQLAIVDVSHPTVPLGDTPYHGFPNRARAVRGALQTALQMGAKAFALVDGGLPAPEPQRVNELVAPVLESGFDYVSPYYPRARYEGALTKGIVYPTFRALYGIAVHQPMASEFSCSARFATHALDQDLWDSEQADAGIDLWLASTAAADGFKICEAVLGTRPTSHETADLSTTLAQVVGALFADIEARLDTWQRTRGVTFVPIFGETSDAEPSVPAPHVDRLVDAFRLGYRELREIWTWVLPAATVVELRRLAESPIERFQFDDVLWAGIIYDFAFGYSERVMAREHLLRSLTPLYSGWLASYCLQVRDASSADVENRIEQVCLAFESQRRHLIARWRWPERLRPKRV
jgi:hypothetical protein